MTIDRTCPVVGCGTALRGGAKVICIDHWRLLPGAVKRDVIATPDSDRDAFIMEFLSTARRCVIPGCGAFLAPGKAVCYLHWPGLPRALQRAILADPQRAADLIGENAHE